MTADGGEAPAGPSGWALSGPSPGLRSLPGETTHSETDAVAESGGQVLVVRCCRLPAFRRALDAVRASRPGAHVCVLTSEEFTEDVRRMGADELIVYAAARLTPGLLRGELSSLLERVFDAIVIPYMNDSGLGYENVRRLALRLRTREYIVVPLTTSPRTVSRYALRHFDSLAGGDGWRRHLDVPLMLGALGLAALLPRRTPRLRPMPPWRVLHVITSMGTGGAQVQMAEVVSRSRSLGFHPSVLVINPADGAFSQRLIPKDVPVAYLDTFPRLFGVLQELYHSCRDGDYDIVHTWLFHANVLGSAAARLGCRSLIVNSVRNLSLWKRTWYRRWWFRFADCMAARTAHVVTVNASVLAADHAWWARMEPREIVVIPNGLSPEDVAADVAGAREWLRRVAGFPADAHVVGTVGRLTEEKDQATFVRVFAQLLERHDIYGVVVGEGDLRVRLERLASELGLTGRLVFLGNREDARRLIAGLDLFILTSAIEGFPNVLLEAVMLGVPAISSDAGGAADVLSGRESVFDVGAVQDAVALASAALGDLELARARATALQARALEEFSSARAAERWVKLYGELISSKGHLRAP